MTCPACNNKRGNARYSDAIGHADVYRCKKCSAVYGSCYKGDSYSIIKPSWHDGDVPMIDTFYFDLTTVGSAGVERRHGWAHKETRQIVQVG